MIVIGDDLVLSKARSAGSAVHPDTYHTLKDLRIFRWRSMWHSPHTRTRPPWRRTRCVSCATTRGMIPAAGSAIASAGLDGEQRERQEAMVEASLKFLDSVIENRRCTAEERIAFARKVNPLIMANDSAAALQRHSTRCTARSVRGGRN